MIACLNFKMPVSARNKDFWSLKAAVGTLIQKFDKIAAISGGPWLVEIGPIKLIIGACRNPRGFDVVGEITVSYVGQKVA